MQGPEADRHPVNVRIAPAELLQGEIDLLPQERPQKQFAFGGDGAGSRRPWPSLSPGRGSCGFSIENPPGTRVSEETTRLACICIAPCLAATAKNACNNLDKFLLLGDYLRPAIEGGVGYRRERNGGFRKGLTRDVLELRILVLGSAELKAKRSKSSLKVEIKQWCGRLCQFG